VGPTLETTSSPEPVILGRTRETFGARIYGEAMARGLERAERLVALTDGAAYNKSILERGVST